MSPPALRSALLDAIPRVRHGFFGRQGGVSVGIYASLNAGPGSSDDPGAVAQNRSRIAAAIGAAPDRLLSAHQIHSATAIRVAEPFAGPRPQGDSLVTRSPGLAVTALAADCAPVLFADAEAGVVAAAHAGWKGALAGILEATVTEMVAAGATRERIVAAIGPCIGQASYEIGPDMRVRFEPEHERFFVPGRADRLHFDLAGFCAARLRGAGLTAIDVIDADTCADETRFFSNRRAFLRGEPDYGRNLSAICLVT